MKWYLLTLYGIWPKIKWGGHFDVLTGCGFFSAYINRAHACALINDPLMPGNAPEKRNEMKFSEYISIANVRFVRKNSIFLLFQIALMHIRFL